MADDGFGSVARPYVEFPFDRITEVHWGGGIALVTLVSYGFLAVEPLGSAGQGHAVPFDVDNYPPYHDPSEFYNRPAGTIPKSQYMDTGIYYAGGTTQSDGFVQVIGQQFVWFDFSLTTGPISDDPGFGVLPPLCPGVALGTRTGSCPGVTGYAQFEKLATNPQGYEHFKTTDYVLVNFAKQPQCEIVQNSDSLDAQSNANFDVIQSVPFCSYRVPPGWTFINYTDPCLQATPVPGTHPQEFFSGQFGSGTEIEQEQRRPIEPPPTAMTVTITQYSGGDFVVQDDGSVANVGGTAGFTHTEDFENDYTMGRVLLKFKSGALIT